MLLGVEEYMDEDHQLSTSIKIGNVVGIGSQSIVSIGGKKGDWAIAGGALVRESIPPYAIFSGSLGRITRYRFSTEVITRLLEAKPFNLSLDESLKMPIQHVEIPLGYFEALSAKRFNVD
jgi:virginiamycin A acetyltransferase